jgi:hypothetical protein
VRPARPANELARLLEQLGVSCQVIAPSLIPRPLATKSRPTEEAVRDLCRTRADMVVDRTRARHRLSRFLLRHGRVWRGGSAMDPELRPLAGQPAVDEQALTTTLGHYQAVLEAAARN